MFFCPGKYVLHQLNELSLVSSVCLDLCISLSSSTVWSSTSSSLARPFLLGLGGRELKEEEEGFWVCVCSRMWQTVSADCLYLSANSGRTICTAVQQKHQSLFITSLTLDMESHKMYYCVFFLAVSSTVYLCFYRNSVLQSICTIAAESHKINVCVSDSKFILLFCKI